MHYLLVRSSLAILLSQSLISPIAIFAQRSVLNDVRALASRPVPAKATDEWPTNTTPIISLDRFQDIAAPAPEPTIRVALATNARSATISTSGQLMNATGDVNQASTLVALDVARVRLEPRLLSPVPKVDPE